MNILLIDTSASCAEFGYSSGNEIIHSYKNCDRNSADTLAFRIDRFYKEAGIKPFETEIVSLSNGPGSFTGLRIGLAFAKGFCFAANSKLLKISSLDILAERAGAIEHKFIAVICSNPGEGEYYYAVYENINGNTERVSDYSIALSDFIAAMNFPVVSDKFLPEHFESTIELNMLTSSSLSSHLRIAIRRAGLGVFADISNAEPYYMKEFTIRK